MPKNAYTYEVYLEKNANLSLNMKELSYRSV